MRVLFQGAGAVGIAGAALLIDDHEVAVASRNPRSSAACPERVRRMRRPQGPRDRRRVPIVTWETALDFEWDLLVLSTRPSELDAAVASAIADLAPPVIAITSQVDGDLEDARARFAPAELVVFSPALLADRPSGTTVRYWSPPLAPAFLMAGNRGIERRLHRELGPLVLSVPLPVLLGAPALLIPYVAELSVHDGDWEALKTHLERPSIAAAEAVRAVTGLPVPGSPLLARCALEAAENVLPIDVTAYAGRHFGRHLGQTIAMLEGWTVQGRARGRAASGAGTMPTLTELAAVLQAS
ncbi:hypothetical protein DFO66_104159 [Brevibacterium sanguinis]|uniref:Ketopantoate reductase n=2 Tax=Brevibacterium TaxID=1696 RepID=A0A366IKU5_9MICO|nr:MULTISPECIES: hypothetical protein [Brevibacterium]RBP65574.1 hypothetical protein DFO66_104159 [Brevibacterium sanguinis]RBP72208.1 hypothetical protein DFO65_104165 [Brevibacterium celere]